MEYPPFINVLQIVDNDTKPHRLPGAPGVIHQDTYQVWKRVQIACTNKTSTTDFYHEIDPYLNVEITES